MRTTLADDQARPSISQRPWVAPALVGAVTAVGTLSIVALDPSDGGAPVCVSRAAFGVDCPLCGGLRCVNALARGDLFTAADHNVLLAVALPAAVVLWALWLWRAVTGRSLRLPRVPVVAWVALAVFVVAFGVLRNVGGDGWIGWLAASASTS